MVDLPPIVNAFVDDRDLVLLYRREDRKLMQRRLAADWASFYRADKFEPHLREMSSSRFVRKISREGDWYRVSWVDAWVRRKAICEDSPLRGAGVLDYEGDVDPVARFFADTGCEVAKPIRCYLDLETDSRVAPRLAAEGKARILMWAVTDVDEQTQVGVLKEDTDAAEKELLEGLSAELEKYDQVVAWNGDEFDFPALRERVRLTRAKFADDRRFVFLDQMVAFERMNKNSSESGEEKTSLALGKVCQRLIGEGKDDFQASKIHQEWAAGGERREVAVRYMIKDTRLQVRLEKKTSYLEIHQAVSEVCRVFPDTKGLHPTRFVDGYMLRIGALRGVHFATKRFGQDIVEGDQFSGAWCMEPKEKGFVEDVHVADFKSLYPSIIISWNMSPDTKAGSMNVSGPIPDGFCRVPAGSRPAFAVDREGILPGALREVLELREKWKKRKKELPPNTPEWNDADRRSMGYKVTANSFYGVMGSPWSRFFDRDIAEGVTTTGVWLIKKVMELAETPAWGMRTIYGDTDSSFIAGGTKERFSEFVESCNKELLPGLVSSCGCRENLVVLDYEKQFERIVFTSKKRYVARFRHYGGKEATADTKPEVVGLEYMRGDANKVARDFQWEAISVACGPDREASLDVARYVEIAARYRAKVLEGTLSIDEVSQTKGLGKETDEYEVKKKKDGTDGAVQPHVQVARILEERGEQVTPGTKISYVIADASKDRSSGLVCIPAVDYDGTNVDRHYLWENLVWPPTGRLLEAAFPDHDWKSWERSRPGKKERAATAAGQAALPFAGGTVVRVPRAPTAKPKGVQGDLFKKGDPG